MSRAAFPVSRRRRYLVALMSVALLPGVAFAPAALAQGTSYSGSAAREADQTIKNAPEAQTGGPLNLPQPRERRHALGDNETMFIRSIAVKGGEGLVDKEKLAALLKPYQGRELSLRQIYALADKITALYRERGYLVAKALVPEQDAGDGTLYLKVVPGSYGAVTVVNKSLVRSSSLEGILKAQGVKEGRLIQKDGMERAMLLMSDLAGAGTPRAVMGAGSQQGASDFQFGVPGERRFDGFVLGDNFGSPYTGRMRAMVGLNLNSPLGIGDRLSAFGMVSETTDLVNGRLAYTLPIGYDGLEAEAAIFRTTYTLGGAFASTEADGVADGASGTLSYPLLRSREDTIVLSGGYTYKRLDDRQLGDSFSERNLSEGTVALSRDRVGDFFGLPLVTNANAAFTYGNVDYPNPAQRAYYQSTTGAVGNFQKLAGGVTATFALAEKLSFIVDARAQKSLSGNLDSSEQFGLTGFYGVRSYNEGLSGDSGWLVTPEFKYALPGFSGWQHALSVFADFGGVALEDGSYTTTQPEYLSLGDIGVGYYAAYEYSPGRMLLTKAFLAQTIDGDPETAKSYDRGTVGLMQAGFTY